MRGPPLPPHLAERRRQAKEAKKTAPRATSGPVLGPARPTDAELQRLAKAAPATVGGGEDDEDDEFIGPAPPMSGVDGNAVYGSDDDEVEEEVPVIPATGDPNKTREEWMIVPPSARRDNSQFATLQSMLRGRKFASKPVSEQTEAHSSWTKAPGDKDKPDAAAKESKQRTSNSSHEKPSRPSRRDAELSQVVEDYNRRHRDKSLAELHDANSRASRDRPKVEREELPAFDRERDMGGGSLMSERQRREFTSKLKSTNSNFAHGQRKYL